MGFNPRARAGRDFAAIDPSSACDMLFQSTRPRGARQKDAKEVVTDFEFQSTRPRGARPAFPLDASGDPNGFQSTRPRGARRTGGESGKVYDPVSIHAPARGATSGFRY